MESVSSPQLTCSSMFDGDREWQVAEYNQDKNDMLFKIAKVTFLITSRTDPEINFVPEKLYSSLKYKFAINVETCGNSTLCAESQLLLADIDIVDSQGNSLMSSNGDDSGKKKTLLKGETHLSLIEKKRKPIIAKKRLNQHNESDSSICTGKTRTLSCISKFQFNDVAYHHQKEFVKFKVGIYSLDGYSNKYPLLSMVSAPFQIYGRRTTEQRDEEVKKKRQYMEMKEKLMDEQPLDSMCSKKIKLQQSSEQEEALLKTYEKELQNLVALFQ